MQISLIVCCELFIGLTIANEFVSLKLVFDT